MVKQLPQLGLVIDLTNTNKYYNGQVSEEVEKEKLQSNDNKLIDRHNDHSLDEQRFVTNDVDYVKIRCPGQMVPPEDVYKE